MAESTLTICFIEAMSAVAWHLWGKREMEDLTAHERAVCDDCVQAGYRRYLYPPAEPDRGVPAGFEWSWLNITTTITTTSGDADQDMPDSFGRLVGDGFTYAADAQVPGVLADVGEGRIRKLRMQFDESGRPRVAALRRKSTDGETRQGWQVMWYPNPDDAYVLTYKFHAEVDALTDTAFHPFGGLRYADAFQAACLERADALVNDVHRGPAYDDMISALASAIKRDRAEQAKFYGEVGTKHEYSDGSLARETNYTMTINDEQVYPSS